jgi:hypothetical protein
VADDFFDALAAASDGDLAGRHGLEVDAAQTFVAAGQREQRAVLEETGDFGAGDASEELNAIGDFQLRSECGVACSLRAFADDLQREVWMRGAARGDGAEEDVVSFDGDQVADGQVWGSGLWISGGGENWSVEAPLNHDGLDVAATLQHFFFEHAR